MGKTSRAAGGTHLGVGTDSSDGDVLLRGSRIAVLDGAIGLAGTPGAKPDTWVTRGAAGLLHVNGTPVTGGGSDDSWVFDVTDYDADPSFSSDSGAAFVEAVADAVAFAQGSPLGFAIVDVPLGYYKIASALIAGGSTLGNAQIPIPVNASTSRKVTLQFRGPGFAGAMPYWLQSAGNNQRWGATLETTLTGQSVSGAWGVPSVIGGPAVSGSSATYGASSALFNNVCVVLDGLGITTPINPTVAAFDFGGMAQCMVTDHGASAMAKGSPTELNSTRPTHDWSFGIRLPQNFNNDLNYIDVFSAYGQYYGLIIGEHAWVGRSASIYCNDGMFIMATSENIHASAFGSISIEACVNGITASPGDSYGAPVHFAAVSFETITGKHIVDSSNALSGICYLTKLDGPTGIDITGAGNLEIIAANQDRGAVTAPNLAATDTAVPNPFYRHAAVCVAGGTVTGIKVDGVTQGITSGTVIVPSGKSIAIVYSDATGLAWKWTLL